MENMSNFLLEKNVFHSFVSKVSKKSLFFLNNVNSFFLFYLFTFRERGKEGEREGEKYQCVVAS